MERLTLWLENDMNPQLVQTRFVDPPAKEAVADRTDLRRRCTTTFAFFLAKSLERWHTEGEDATAFTLSASALASLYESLRTSDKVRWPQRVFGYHPHPQPLFVAKVEGQPTIKLVVDSLHPKDIRIRWDGRDISNNISALAQLSARLAVRHFTDGKTPNILLDGELDRLRGLLSQESIGLLEYLLPLLEVPHTRRSAYEQLMGVHHLVSRPAQFQDAISKLHLDVNKAYERNPRPDGRRLIIEREGSSYRVSLRRPFARQRRLQPGHAIYVQDFEVPALLDVKQLQDRMKKALLSVHSGEFINRPRQRYRIKLPAGKSVMFHQMSAASRKVLVEKRYLSSRQYPRGKEFHVELFDLEKQELVALIEADILSQIRTGAMSGLAAAHLAPRNTRTVGMIGTGRQAFYQLYCVCIACPGIETIILSRRQIDRLESSVGEFTNYLATNLPTRKFTVTGVKDANTLAGQCDILITITNAASPVICCSPNSLKKDLLLIAAGSNHHRRCEVSPQLVRNMDRVVVDSLEQAKLEAGDLLYAWSKPKYVGPLDEAECNAAKDSHRWDTVVEFAELLQARACKRSGKTLFESQGLAIQDVVAANLVYEQLLARQSLANLVSILERNAKCHSDRVALVGPNSEVRYAELYQHVLRVARVLKNKGVAPGNRVALSARNSVQSTIAFFGILASGASVIAVDPETPPADLRGILALESCVGLIADRSLDSSLLARTGKRTLKQWCVELAALETDDPPLDESVLVAPDNEAVVLLTSGGDGKSKMVSLSHNTLLKSCQVMADLFGLSERDRIAARLPFFYSFGLRVVQNATLASGATLVYFPDDSAETLFAGLRSSVFTFLALTPPILRGLVKVVQEHPNSRINSPRFIVSAGSPLGVRQRKTAEDLLRTNIRQSYGMTEASQSAFQQFGQRQIVGSVGQAVDGVEIRVVDESNQPCLSGIHGSIEVRGEHLMRGYLDDQGDLVTYNSQWHRTGDYGKLDEQGNLYVMGRESNRISVGGKNVYLGRIEFVLLKHELVEEACVIGAVDGRIRALIVVPRESASLNQVREVLTRFCSENLDIHERPTEMFVTSKPLPRNRRGKIAMDRAVRILNSQSDKGK